MTACCFDFERPGWLVSSLLAPPDAFVVEGVARIAARGSRAAGGVPHGG